MRDGEVISVGSSLLMATATVAATAFPGVVSQGRGHVFRKVTSLHGIVKAIALLGNGKPSDICIECREQQSH